MAVDGSGFQLPGYDVVELLGDGSAGEVWLAREEATGEQVALRCLRGVGDLATRDRLRREAAVIAGVEHPHLVRLRTVLGAGDSMVLVLDLAAGGSLARLVGARGALPAAEVRALVVPLAEALAHVHGLGLVHGCVSPATVLFTADGRPVLSDLATPRPAGPSAVPARAAVGFLDPAADPGPAGDVHGLAATCLAALAGRAPYDEHGRRRPRALGAGPLLDVLEQALHPDPACRPSAAELAAAAAAAVPTRPVIGPCAGRRSGTGRRSGAGRRRRPSRRARPPRTAVAVLLGAAALAMAAVTGVSWAGADAERPAARLAPGATPDRSAAPRAELFGAATTGPAAAPGRPHWTAVLGRLDALRSRAYATGDTSVLDGVYADGSPAATRDRATLAHLSRAGLRADGLRLVVAAVTERRLGSSEVRLEVRDTMVPYLLVDEAGTTVERRPGRAERAWLVTLRRERGGWRVYDVVAR